MNAENVEVLQSKHKFDEYFSDYIGRDYLYVHDASFDDFCNFIKKHPTYMTKANWACEGVGIAKYTVESTDDLKKLFEKYCSEYVLLEEVIQQHEKMNELNSSSVNTVRVATLNHNGKIHIVAASLRIGAGGVTDNLHGGGICCAIEVDTGIVKSLGYDGKINRYLKHPITETIIPGFQVPNWDKVISTAIEAAEKVPQFKWIGWDIAVTDDGVSVIEGNHNQGIDLIQIGNEGLRPRIKEILNS